jgi:tRNA(Ile)-lysidine synthase
MASSANKSASAAEAAASVESEAATLLGVLSQSPALILAVSGGPDSTALMVLAARWRALSKGNIRLIAVTVDHGLRREARREAAAVARLARALGIEHRTLHWTGRKPKTGLQEAARNARYRLLAQAACKVGARHVLTAHTLDDQAETVLFRLVRGSGIGGLASMGLIAPIPVREGRGLSLIRPLLRIPKARLIAMLNAAGVPYTEDPTNRDFQFTRPRLRALMPALAREGLTPARMARLAERVARMETALWVAVHEAETRLAKTSAPDGDRLLMTASAFFELPDEIALRLLGRAIQRMGDEGPVELGKLEALGKALVEGHDMVQRAELTRVRRTLAGALITLDRTQLRIERAPPRRAASKRP